MARGKNKPKLTNKQIENALKNLIASDQEKVNIINNVMKVVTFYIEYKDDTKEFEKFLKNKLKENKENS
tara:strand:+ start:2251 stop:2457 length:207 start_codon:yes stop_codon:yes gene_type:complete